VYVNTGAIIDVVLDIRKNSPTFGKNYSIKVTQEEPKLIYIPIGCAHGFLSLEDNTMVTYLQTTCYMKTADEGIRFNSFGFDWGVQTPIISERDSCFIDFDSFKTPFKFLK
jgi:dTDP-4-dehydrorhamnose 3,5-epimerase/CDP-3, 6-dideoxy-D-glycero-D-glycero-4-hexulose-5-epimerase